MFIGHYGASYAATKVEPRLPLWLFFLAVQFLDIMWAIFVLLGIEHVRIVPGFTASNPLDLYHMPYTHSLTGAIGWSIAVALFYRWFSANEGVSGKSMILLGAAVFSHWVFDLPVHTPDMPLWGDRFKVGLGLWNYPAIALSLEVVVLFAGLWLYLRATRPVRKWSTAAFLLFGVALCAIQVMTSLGAPPESPTATAVTALLGYLALAALAVWLGRTRESRIATA